MNINDVIKIVANLLQLNNLIDADLESYNTLDDQTKKDINLIVSSTNEVLSDIATDYFPLKATEQITVLNGSFDLTTLTHDFHKLLSVATTNAYEVEMETLKIQNGCYKLKYSYLPEVLELGDDIEVDKRVTIFALCFGVCGEFCLVSGNYAESEMWNSKYQNAISVCKRSLKMPRLKNRRWI